MHWKLGTASDRGSHVRTGTINEEYGPGIAAVIMDLLLDPTLRQ